MKSIKDHCVVGGWVLFSGLLAGDRSEVVKYASEYGLSLEAFTEKDNWLALKMRG